MTATNHIVSGSIIGALLPLPIAIPVALASHFVLDAIPHYGLDDHHRGRAKLFKVIVFGDTAIALTLCLVMLMLQKWTMLICGLVAFSPDAAWIVHYFQQGRNMGRLKSNNRFNNWHQNKIQYERPWGIYVELVLLAVMLPVFINQLTKN